MCRFGLVAIEVNLTVLERNRGGSHVSVSLSCGGVPPVPTPVFCFWSSNGDLGLQDEVDRSQQIDIWWINFQRPQYIVVYCFILASRCKVISLTILRSASRAISPLRHSLERRQWIDPCQGQSCEMWTLQQNFFREDLPSCVILHSIFSSSFWRLLHLRASKFVGSVSGLPCRNSRIRSRATLTEMSSRRSIRKDHPRSFLAGDRTNLA